ncbi:MAG: hypothetical protein HRT72_10365 [Flavobacteriales bacterium]|nr:hypothetical protein [Flavobacteriales bacterium]
MSTIKVILGAFLLLLISTIGKSQIETDSIKPPLFELSFGQSILFISESKIVDVRNSEAVVLPTSSILFFTELRPLKRIRFPFYFNLPTETKQFLVDSILFNEKARPSFGAGIEFRVAAFPISKETEFEFEVGPLVNVLFTEDKNIIFSPVAAIRFRLVKNENFVMYLGSSYSIGINSFGLLYGTGFIF